MTVCRSICLVFDSFGPLYIHWNNKQYKHLLQRKRDEDPFYECVCFFALVLFFFSFYFRPSVIPQVFFVRFLRLFPKQATHPFRCLSMRRNVQFKLRPTQIHLQWKRKPKSPWRETCHILPPHRVTRPKSHWYVLIRFLTCPINQCERNSF